MIDITLKDIFITKFRHKKSRHLCLLTYQINIKPLRMQYYMFRKIQHLVGITDLIVIPGNKFNQFVIY